MSSTDDDSKRSPVEVIDWNGLIRYTQLLSQGNEKRIKICMIDEEQEEIRLQTKEEFDLNVQYARDSGSLVLKLIVYMDNKFLFNGIYQIEKAATKTLFPSDKLQILVDNVLAEKWYIPVKQHEALGVCLTTAIQLAQERKLEANADCQQFIETILPAAFRKLQNTPSVYSWPREIQYGIFEMVELLVDLVGTRVRYPPVPITLLNVLAVVLDIDTAFSQKHKNELLPARRVYALADGEFLRDNSGIETFGWLRSILQRFIAQHGLKHVRLQFEYIDSADSNKAAKEYTALLKLFSRCHSCIDAHRFRSMFSRPIHQATEYLQRQTPSDEINELNKTLTEICQIYDIKDEFDQSLALAFNPTLSDNASAPVDTTPLIELPITGQRKSESHDYYERLTDNIRSLTMNNNDVERKSIKKQRTSEQVPAPLFTRHHVIDCIDELLTLSDKRSLKRKHRREQQRSSLTSMNHLSDLKKETKRSNTMVIPSSQTYDRSDPEDILRYFAPIKMKVAGLYDDLQTATCDGKIREVLKIEEKLKLLHPFSARFIADENTPDGTVMQPGQVFRKAWILLNDGSLPWDNQDIQLINLADSIRVLQPPVVPVTAPHDKAVITVDYVCANESGMYESKWILAYRQQTFGPMIWCSIEVRHSTEVENAFQSTMTTSAFDDIKEPFEFVDVPLPACFDLSKPFQLETKTMSNTSSLRSSFSLPQIDSVDRLPALFDRINVDCLLSDSDSLSNLSYSPETEPTSLIELAPPTDNTSTESPILVKTNQETPSPTTTTTTAAGEDSPARTQPSMDFVDTMVTNIFSVAKQASSTAKAIFHTLQAFDEPIASPTEEEQQPTLINTYHTNQTSTSSFFDSVKQTSTASVRSVPSVDPVAKLVEMGFANRGKNQRLLRENANDLAKVIELLTLDGIDDPNWFSHRH